MKITETARSPIGDAEQKHPRLPVVQKVPTFGKLFSDGLAIERLRGGNLVIAHRSREQSAPEFSHSDGCQYQGALLDPSFEVLFPSRSSNFGSVADLIEDAEKKIVQLLAADESSAFLLASFAASTWLQDVLPATPVINICTPPGADARIVSVLASICRRGLVLAQPSIAELLNLPTGFAPTLIMRPTNLRSLAPWLSTVTGNDVRILRDAALLSLRYPVAILSSEPNGSAALNVVLPNNAPWRPLSAHERVELMDQFQPRFLSLRLHRHLQVTASRFEVRRFTGELRMVAAWLGATLDGAPELQRRLIEVLECVNEEAKVLRSQSTTAVVLEALLAKCHGRADHVYTGDIAELANVILLGRQEILTLTPRGVGEILRKSTGLPGKRDSGGFRILLNRKAVRKVHDSAEFYGVLCPSADCRYCDELNHRQQSTNAVYDVHDVPDIHDDQVQGGTR